MGESGYALMLRARAALAIMRLAEVLAFDKDQLRDRRGRWVKDPRTGARPSEGGGAGAGGSGAAVRSLSPRTRARSDAVEEPHPVDERAELRAIQLAEIDRDVAAGRRRDATQTRIDRAEIAIRRHADAVKMHDNEPDDQRWTAELREAEASLAAQGVTIEPYGYTQTGHGGSTVRYNAFGAHDERAGREAELDARPGALGPTPEIGPDGKYTKPVKQYATWNGRTETRTSRNPYKYAAVVQYPSRDAPDIVSWHRTRAAAEKGTLTKNQRDNGVRVVGVAEVSTDAPRGAAA